MAASGAVLFYLLLLCSWQQLIDSASPSCGKRWQWHPLHRCPPSAGHSSAAISGLSTEAQCALLCTKRLPACKAAHFKDSLCSLAVNWTQLSHWTTGGAQCKSLVLAPDIFHLLAFYDFREALTPVIGWLNATSDALELTQDKDAGLHFAGRMSSLMKLTVSGGLSPLIDHSSGERAVSFFMRLRRSYKARSVFVKVSAESPIEPSACNLYEQDGKLKFSYSGIGSFTSALAFMQTDAAADPNGFFLGVSASNITGAYAFIDNRLFDLAASGSVDPGIVDSVIRLGVSSSSDASCFSGTMTCFGIAPVKLGAQQFARLSKMCQ